MKRPTIKSARDNRPLVARTVIRLALGFVVAIVGTNFCGCALHKPLPHATIVNRALPKATPLPPTWSAASDNVNVSDDWVKSFNDHGLEVVVREAIANNLDLRQAAAQVEAARQKSRLSCASQI